MTALRLISFPTHAVFELLLGLVLIAAPFALGLTPAGLLAAVLAGALVVGMALSASTHDGRGLAVSAHWALDRGTAFGLLGGALVLGLAGDTAAAALFAAGALAQGVLNLTTRYTARA